MADEHWDAVIVGSGFGGSVSALRLAEKGYRVLVVEMGRRFAPGDFPKSTWDLKRFMWRPELGMTGPFRMSFTRHVTALHGIGVGGGSLIYANTLPMPGTEFFTSGSWAGLADWQAELAPHYATAQRMLGAAQNPYPGVTDKVLAEIAEERGQAEHYRPTDVGVFFGTPREEVPDPYFDGRGPSRTGCHFCGGCMLGCRHGAKNTLDKNYLWLAEKHHGAEIRPETKVVAVRPDPSGGYQVVTEPTFGRRKPSTTLHADRVVFSGGVMGTTELLLQMKADPTGLPELSDHVGESVRTNSETLIGVTSRDPELDLTQGVAIGSILHTDPHSHLEPVRYPAGSGLYRLMVLPHAPGATLMQRMAASVRTTLTHPRRALAATFVKDWSKSTAILLYMRSTEGTLGLTLGRFGLTSRVTAGEAPTAAIPEATELADQFADKLDGFVVSMFTETLANIPTTAHILGGATIGATAAEGVIGPDHQVHGYPGLYVCDGAAVSANPGVNPSLTITAMSERAMAAIPTKAG